MKRLSILFLLALALFSVLPVLAQDNAGLITLNDATPAIDVIISLPPDTTGAIALDFSGAAVTLTDAVGSVVFQAGNVHLHGLELNLAPNTGSHTLTVSRLPGLAQASVQVRSLPELTQNGTVEQVTTRMLTFNQAVSLPLSNVHPGDTVSVSIPNETTGVLTATFPRASATTQLVDANGIVIAGSSGGHVDGMNLVLDTGEYQFTLMSSDLSEPVFAGIQAVSATDGGFIVLQAPESTVSIVSSSITPCVATVNVSSTNLRSGPGTGYSILGYGYRNQTFSVGGHNPEDNWLVVQTDVGSAWVARTNIHTQGDCTSIEVFNIPLRDAQPVPLVITTPALSDRHDDEDEQEHHESSENSLHEGDD